jgi:hypothetical protein
MIFTLIAYVQSKVSMLFNHAHLAKAVFKNLTSKPIIFNVFSTLFFQRNYFMYKAMFKADFKV